jgi:hypothetical protein
MIGLAQFRNRSPYHLVRSRSIFANCIADFYDARRMVFWKLTPFFRISNRMPRMSDPTPQDSAYCFFGGLVLETCMAICHEPALLTTVIP